MLNIWPNDNLAINCLELHLFSKNEAVLRKLLCIFCNLRSNVVTLLEVKANYNGALFIIKFIKALHYYYAMLDPLERTLDYNNINKFLY